jgi:predicted metal-dependent HD superfamily phosphohydrolase
VSDALLRRWLALLPSGDSAGRDLLRRWSEPQRHYHTLTHLRTLLDLLDGESPALLLAVWFHDAIYDPRAGDNEEASATLARASLPALGIDAATTAEVNRLVLLTKQHTTTPDDRAGQLLLDADLSILGSPEAEYDAYAAAIRREYAWVAESAYRTGRAAVLRTFLSRPHLYQTDRFRRSHEEQARRNLTREIAALVTDS